ncbi:hypothetical protein BMS3Abin15_01172 [bacterium BMS3Abin15]|nr:hypothetical protein BMS3Abin15_01172 [bacterium BMS3Abin15]HDZ85172.1 methyltransferase domain-containing protein [Candidatus Moranbacteria bacterium]
MLLGNLDLKKVGNRLRRLDRFLLDVYKERLAHGGLSDYVAQNKRKASPDGIFNKRRQEIEESRIRLARKWAEQNGIDPNFAASLMYQTISESCRVQDEMMFKKHRSKEVVVDENSLKAIRAFQKEDLLRLTSKVAGFYDKSYAEGFFGTRLYMDFEKEVLYGLMANLQNKLLAVDLGCATGVVSLDIATQFEKVVGLDISPEMIEVAKKKITNRTANAKFKVADIEDGVNIPKNSISLAIMNMGTASEIENFKGFLKWLKRSLRPDGKFLLSFYNSESLMTKLGFLPWPVPLAAHIDLDKRCLEVHYNGEIYFLYARPRGVEEIKKLLSESGFEIDKIYTFPTCASVLPDIVLDNEDDSGVRQPNKEAQNLVKKIDSELAESVNSGTYIIVTGGKVVK